jgi:hypothetical protein
MPDKAVKKSDKNKGSMVLPDDIELPKAAGLEDADRDSYAIPFLVILQKTSPKADPDHEAYVNGAQAGMLLDTVSDIIMDPEKEDIIIIPVFFRRAFIEWKTREDGGGFIGEHSLAEAAEMKWERTDKGDILENGNQIVDTRYHYVILVRKTSIQPMVITMTSTQVKKSKRLNGDMANIVRSEGLRAIFELQYQITTVKESNEHGTWRGWQINRAGKVDNQDHFDAALEFYQAIKSGEVKEATETLNDADPASSNSQF